MTRLSPHKQFPWRHINISSTISGCCRRLDAGRIFRRFMLSYHDIHHCSFRYCVVAAARHYVMFYPFSFRFLLQSKVFYSRAQARHIFSVKWRSRTDIETGPYNFTLIGMHFFGCQIRSPSYADITWELCPETQALLLFDVFFPFA